MATSCQLDDKNQETTYTFRFCNNDKVIQLTEEQLNCIPYLSLLVAHNNDFESVQNEDGQYILNSRIRYNWFMPILHAATTPSKPKKACDGNGESSKIFFFLFLLVLSITQPIEVC